MISTGCNIEFFIVLQSLNVDFIVYIVENTFSPFDIVFYLIAIYEGYYFSFMTKHEVIQKIKKIANARTYTL